MEELLARAADIGLDAWVPPIIPRIAASEIDPASFERCFLRRNLPVVIEGALDHWPAMRRWDPAYLVARSGDAQVGVNITPDGWGDALVRLPPGHPRLAAQACEVDDPDLSGPAGDATTVFVAPQEVTMRFGDLLRELCPELRRSDLPPCGASTPESPPAVRCCRAGVPYLSSQNDNLRRELPALAADVGDIPCLGWEGGVGGVLRCLGAAPDAVNLWVGDSRSTSSLHKDHYENLYAVIRGRKEFTLLPPLALPGLRERVYVCARYAWREHVPAQIPPAGGGEGSPSSDAAVSRGAAEGSATADGARTGTWAVEIDRDEAGRPRRVPWVSVNPCAAPDSCPPAYAAVARHARTVTLGPGDLLYLPALWYHQVGQGPAGGGHGEEEEEGLTIAVNAWFDMAFDGPAYAYYVALRAALGLA